MNWFTAAAMVCLLVAASLVDLKKRIIPNIVVAAIFVLGIAERLLLFQKSGYWVFLDGAIGLVIGSITFILAGMIGKAATGREAMGWGDVKLMAASGYYLGWEKTVVALFLSVFIGGLVGGIGLFTRKLKRGDEIPFGPMLSAGIIAAVFWGDWLIKWYLNL